MYEAGIPDSVYEQSIGPFKHVYINRLTQPIHVPPHTRHVLDGTELESRKVKEQTSYL